MRKSSKRAGMAALVAAVMGPTIAASMAASNVATWIGPGGSGGNGTYTVAANWSGGVVPANGTPGAGDTYSIFIDGGQAAASVATLSGAIGISELNISAGDGLTVSGAGSLTVLGGTIHNAGVLTLSAIPSGTTELRIGGPSVTLTGGGTLVTAGTSPASAWIYSEAGTSTGSERLINHDNTIRGGGRILMPYTNEAAGVIDGDIAGQQFVLISNSNGAVNAGLIRARNGGSMRIRSQYNPPNPAQGLINTGGVIRVDSTVAPSGLLLEGSMIDGGTIEFLGSNGTMEVQNSTNQFSGNLNLNSSSTMRLNGTFSSSFTITGSLNNPAGGKIILEAISRLTFQGSGSFINGGEIILNDHATFPGRLMLNGTNSGGTCTLGGGGTITMPNSTSDAFSGLRFTNVDNTIDGGGRITAITFNNGAAGTVCASKASGMTISADITNAGTFDVLATRTMTLNSGTYSQVGGVTHVDGTLNATSITISGGNVSGLGTIASNINLTGSASLQPGNSAGQLDVVGSLSFASSSNYALELAGTASADRVDITGAATLGNSTLAVSLVNGYIPQANDKFTILTAGGGVNGKFSQTSGRTISPTKWLATIYQPNSVIVAVALPGDADLNGFVDVLDLGTLATSWQQSGTWLTGDFDGNGSVDVLDLGLLASNWQQGVVLGSPLGSSMSFEAALATVGLPSASTPEPAVLLPLTFAVLLFRRR